MIVVVVGDDGVDELLFGFVFVVGMDEKYFV